jgi:hypothetical protein
MRCAACGMRSLRSDMQCLWKGTNFLIQVKAQHIFSIELCTEEFNSTNYEKYPADFSAD